MLSRFRHWYLILLFLFVAACSGGGCSGCSGCGGTTPLPGGFPTDKAVENAASIRVSRPGLTFLESQIPDLATKATGAMNGTMTIQIPDTKASQKDAFCLGGKIGSTCIGISFDVDFEICVGGPDPAANPPKCIATVNLGKATFKLDSVKPDALVVQAYIPIQLTNMPTNVDLNPGPSVTASIGYGANGTCVGSNKELASVGVKNAGPINVTIPLKAQSLSPRDGYTAIDVDNAIVDVDQAIGTGDVQICTDCGFLSDVFGYNACDEILNAGFIKGYIVDKMKGQLAPMIKGLLRDQLCTKPDPTLNPPCPTNSEPDSANKHCVYSSKKDQCVSTLLGTDAHIDLGGFLRSISPGAEGGLDFGLASGGDMIPAPSSTTPRTNGVTLAMIGGVLPQPPSKCVPQAPVTIPTGIPIPDEISPTKPDGATAPHVGIALSGRFLDYSMTSVYNSGLLCLGVSTEQFDMLKSGLLSLLVPSLKQLTFEEADAAAAINTRPQKPPVVKVGGGTNVDTDPLLLITAPEFAIDFYVWSYDRFARIFTFTGDLTVPVNLQSGKDGITPAIGKITVKNAKVDNSKILYEKPELIAGGLQELLGTVSKQLVGGGMKPIDLSTALKSLGLGLEVNEIKKLTKGTDDFVGIFATMNKAMAAMPEADTAATLLSKKVDKEHMALDTYSAETLPELELALSSPLDDGTRPIEYTWWIDKGTRAPWSAEKHLVIKDGQLFMQGKHVLHVVARVAGSPETEDATPADVPFTIDALAPFTKLEVDHKETKATLTAWDLVSSKDALVARVRLGDAPFGEWRPLADVGTIDVGSTDNVEVEVKDEEGNIGTVKQALRGRADPSLAATGSGCGCSTPGNKMNDANAPILAVCLALGALSFMVLRRRRGARAAAPVAALVSTLAVASTSQGCDCGGDGDSTTGCGPDCNTECQTGLSKGQPGSYLSVAKSKDGTIWTAGYNDSALSEGSSQLYGDLVVGKYDLGKQAVDWETVDGIPTRTDGTCPTFEPGGFRKGEQDSGDNVGRWPSIVMSSTGDKPMVSYYDDTTNRLKFAINDDGWKVVVLKEAPRSDIGRYSKMVLVGGKPVIAFMVVEPGNGGHSRSKVSIARAKVEEPHGAEDFSFEDAAIDESSPCRFDTCGAGEKCVKSTGICTKTVTGCTPADCGAGSACVMAGDPAKATCSALVSEIETYPRALGGYISLAAGPKGLGIAFYDGYHGNLVALEEQGPGKWNNVILDGETGLRTNNTARDTGDVGMAASLAIAPSGQWHVSYINGIDETLRYINFADGKPGKSEVVDDGSEVDGKTFPDGKHLVGDDSAIHVDGDVITVYYTDSSSLGVRKAVGTTSAGAHNWDKRTVAVPKTWVLFPQFVPADTKALAFWRQTNQADKTVEADVIMLP